MSQLVEIDGEALDASRRPPRASRLVRRASSRLAGELELSRLAASLDAVGASLRAAHAGTAPFHDLQLRVQRAGFGVTRLGGRAASELDAARHAAAAALDDLECVRDLLADGIEDVALATLRAASGTAARLAASARALAADFDAAAEDAHATLAAALARREEQGRRRAELARSVTEYRILLVQAQNAKRATEDSFDEADRLYEDAVRKEGIASLKNNTLQAAQVAGAVAACMVRRPGLGVVGVGGVSALSSAVESEMLRVREEKAVYLHERYKQRTSAVDIGREIAELNAKLRLARDEDTIALETVQSLEDSVTGLRALAAVMLKAETFWSRLDAHYGQSEAAALESLIESSRTLSREERMKIWDSDQFKRKAMMVCAPWVALENTCGDYHRLLSGTHSRLLGIAGGAGDTPLSAAGSSSRAGSSGVLCPPALPEEDGDPVRFLGSASTAKAGDVPGSPVTPVVPPSPATAASSADGSIATSASVHGDSEPARSFHASPEAGGVLGGGLRSRRGSGSDANALQ